MSNSSFNRSDQKPVFEYIKYILVIASFVFPLSFIITNALAQPARGFTELKAMLASGKLEEADKELKRLESIYGQNTEELIAAKAELLNKKGNKEYNAGEMQQSASSQRLALDIRLDDARALLASGNHAGAQNILFSKSPEVRASPPGRLLQAEIWQAKAEEFYKSGQKPIAREFYIKAYEIWPNHPLIRQRYLELINYKPPVVNTNASRPPLNSWQKPARPPITTHKSSEKHYHFHVHESAGESMESGGELEIENASGVPAEKENKTGNQLKKLEKRLAEVADRLQTIQHISIAILAALGIICFQLMRSRNR